MWSRTIFYIQSSNLSSILYLPNSWFFWAPEAERKKKEETERLAKLAEILEKQRQREREVEEKAEKQKREALAGKPNEPALRPYKPPPARRSLESDTAAPATSSAPAPGKYIPKFRRGGA